MSFLRCEVSCELYLASLGSKLAKHTHQQPPQLDLYRVEDGPSQQDVMRVEICVDVTAKPPNNAALIGRS